MNNRLKFRAWNGKMMYYDGDGVILQFKGGRWAMITTDSSDSIYWAEEGKEGHVLMQFTGLLDKNGREIFESDVVTWGRGIKRGEVFWDEYKWNVSDHWGTSADNPGDAFSEGVFEIIGNIYENPELINN